MAKKGGSKLAEGLSKMVSSRPGFPPKKKSSLNRVRVGFRPLTQSVLKLKKLEKEAEATEKEWA